jgi:spermidine synthase
LHLYVQDAFEFVRRAQEPYDLIVADSTDVYEEEDGGLSERLFTEEFYRDLLRVLSPSGMVVTQADNPLFCPYSLDGIREAFSSVFPKVGSYHALVPSFGGFSAFCWGSQGAEPVREFPVDRAEGVPLRYLSRETLALAFRPLPF